jgi:hypothetical protein
MFYYFMGVYNASASEEGVYEISSGGKAWLAGPGIEDHAQRLAMKDAGKTLCILGMGFGIVILAIGARARYGGSVKDRQALGMTMEPQACQDEPRVSPEEQRASQDDLMRRLKTAGPLPPDHAQSPTRPD